MEVDEEERGGEETPEKCYTQHETPLVWAMEVDEEERGGGGTPEECYA